MSAMKPTNRKKMITFCVGSFSCEMPASVRRLRSAGSCVATYTVYVLPTIIQVTTYVHPCQYFAIGHSSRCFSFIRNWVEMRIRRHLGRACQRRGFGWKRWSREWMYGTLGLFSEYRVSYAPSLSAVAPV